MRFIAIWIMLLWAVPCVAAPTAESLILRLGTLDDLTAADVLVYDQTASLQSVPDLTSFETGQVKITSAPDDMVTMSFHKKAGERRLGQFPQSVGNPLFMYFIETVIRDMARATGGSPFYIRNRVKAALVEGADVTQMDISFGGQPVLAQQIIMRPFVDDPNKDRMQGFETLTITVTVSDAVLGWYVTLEASAGDSAYRRSLTRTQGVK